MTAWRLLGKSLNDEFPLVKSFTRSLPLLPSDQGLFLFFCSFSLPNILGTCSGVNYWSYLLWSSTPFGITSVSECYTTHHLITSDFIHISLIYLFIYLKPTDGLLHLHKHISEPHTMSQFTPSFSLYQPTLPACLPLQVNITGLTCSPHRLYHTASS